MNRTLPALLVGASLLTFVAVPAAAARPTPVVHPADVGRSVARLAASGAQAVALPPSRGRAAARPLSRMSFARAAAADAQPLPQPHATTPRPHPPADDASGLVPGLPQRDPYQQQQEQQKLPDRALPPNIPRGRMPQEPEPDRPLGPVRHIELVPRSEVQGEGGAKVKCSPSTGPAQKAVEEFLEREPDGVQSPEDCQAIRSFQRAHQIEPATGFAGPVTGAVVRLLRAQKDPNHDQRCPERTVRVVCVDLNRQLLWVQQDGEVVFRPVAVRSGRPQMDTRNGTYRIYWRHKNHMSSLYHTPMPFAQFFDGGEALHGVYDDVYAGAGSHGCINLQFEDSEKLWGLLDRNDLVYVWGHKTGV
ncbi:L,D-transpeptidase family protein [Streptomyces gilvosporeus]|nr:L,D-transpeptidase family protein [Streptomyces gilvosporeus]